MLRFLHTKFPFRIFFRHGWRYFSDGYKRDCKCGAGNLCSDNGGPWYHMTPNGAVVPHMPAKKPE